MNMSNLNRKFTAGLFLLIALATLGGCKTTEEPAVRACNFFGWDHNCDESSAPPPPSPPPAETPPASTDDTNSGGTGQVRVNHVVEWEPNNTLDNANTFSFPAKGTADAVAIDVDGSVQEGTDPADFFIFTPAESGTFLIYLCGETCIDRVENDLVYLMVYDQSQTTIAGTPVGTVAEQFIHVELTAGLAYYVEINGYNTAAAAFPYRLTIID